MTVNEILSALAHKLGELFPERAVYYTQIPREADGNHYIRCIDQSHTKKLGRRRERAYSFEVLYFCQKGDALVFNDWAETLYSELEMLTVGGQLVHITGAHAEPGDDGVFHFVFDITVSGLLDPPAGEPMAELEIREGLKE